MPKKTQLETLLQVQILEAKPNKMFTENQRRMVRFLRFNQYLPCAHCGKKVRVHWTMLCAFRSIDMRGAMFSINAQRDGKPFPPLTPVCGDHPLAPDWQKKERKAPKKK